MIDIFVEETLTFRQRFLNKARKRLLCSNYAFTPKATWDNQWGATKDTSSAQVVHIQCPDIDLNFRKVNFLF